MRPPLATEIRQAVAKRDEPAAGDADLHVQEGRPAAMDEVTGLIDNVALDTRVAWVRDLLDRVTVEAARNTPWPSGGRHPTTVLIGRIQ